MIGAMEIGEDIQSGFNDLKDTITGEKARQKEQAEEEAALQADIDRVRAKFEAEHPCWTLQMFVPETEHRFMLHFSAGSSNYDTRIPSVLGLYNKARYEVQLFAPLLHFHFHEDAKLYFNDVLIDLNAKDEDGESCEFNSLPAYCGMQDGDEVVLVLPPGFWATSALFEKARDELRAANPCPEQMGKLNGMRDSYRSGEMFNRNLSIAKDCSITWNLSGLYLKHLVPSMAALKYGTRWECGRRVAGLDLRDNRLEQIPEYIRSLSPEETRDFSDQFGMWGSDQLGM